MTMHQLHQVHTVPFVLLALSYYVCGDTCGPALHLVPQQATELELSVLCIAFVQASTLSLLET